MSSSYPMSLLKPAWTAITDYFTQDELSRAIAFCLDVTLEEIVPPGSFRDQAFKLLMWAQRGDKILDLLMCLAETRPNVTTFEATAALLQDVQQGSCFVRPLPSSLQKIVPLIRPRRNNYFFGRSRELLELCNALQPGRVVTICGTGGVGKSALAAEIVWSLAPAGSAPEKFPDGIVYFSFQTEPHAEKALQAIALAYHVAPLPSPAIAVQQVLSGKHALLVLDGADQADNLTLVLRQIGNCGVLITSRKHIPLADKSYDLGSLEPDVSLAMLQTLASQQTTNVGASKTIVQILDGLPFALFLAAKYLTNCGQQAEDFVTSLQHNRLGALHLEDATDQSVPKLMEHSLAQVSDQAREAFAVVGMLSFAPFDADIVAATLKAGQPADAHFLLGQLVDFGLISHGRNHSYRVTHALAHEYAQKYMQRETHYIDRLVDYFVVFTRTANEMGVEDLFRQLNRYRPHIVRIMQLAVSVEKWQSVIEIANNVDKYLEFQGYLFERIGAATAAVQACQAIANPELERAYWGALGDAYFWLDDMPNANKTYETRLRLARESGNILQQCECLGNLGRVSLTDDSEEAVLEAIGLFEEQLNLAEQVNDKKEIGKAQGNLGRAYLRSDNRLYDSVELFAQQLAQMQEIRDEREQSMALENIGLARKKLGDIEKRFEDFHIDISAESKHQYYLAVEAFEQALTIVRRVQDRKGEASICWNLGLAYLALGQFENASNYMRIQIDFEQSIGHPHAEMHYEYLDKLLRYQASVR